MHITFGVVQLFCNHLYYPIGSIICGIVNVNHEDIDNFWKNYNSLQCPLSFCLAFSCFVIVEIFDIINPLFLKLNFEFFSITLLIIGFLLDIYSINWFSIIFTASFIIGTDRESDFWLFPQLFLRFRKIFPFWSNHT